MKYTKFIANDLNHKTLTKLQAATQQRVDRDARLSCTIQSSNTHAHSFAASFPWILGLTSES